MQTKLRDPLSFLLNVMQLSYKQKKKKKMQNETFLLGKQSILFLSKTYSEGANSSETAIFNQ